jgi:hypothetical protein
MERETAVEWLKSQMENTLNGYFGSPWVEVFEQAKAMEKEQIEEAFKHGELPKFFDNLSAEQYYNEIYNKM